MKLYYDYNRNCVITEDELADVFRDEIAVEDVICHFDNPKQILLEVFSKYKEVFEEYVDEVIDDWIDNASTEGYHTFDLSDDARQVIEEGKDD